MTQNASAPPPAESPAPGVAYVLPPSKGRRPAHNAYEIARPLSADDVASLWTEGGRAPIGAIKALRYSHHLLARLVAQGKTGHELCAITGLSLSRISTLRADPTFSELVEFYAEDLREIYRDVHSQMAALATDAVDELRERFEREPEKFTKRELMELFAMMADRSIPTAKGGPAPQAQQASGGGSPLSLQINFVTAQSAEGTPLRGDPAPQTLELAALPPTPQESSEAAEAPKSQEPEGEPPMPAVLSPALREALGLPALAAEPPRPAPVATHRRAVRR